MELSEGDVVTAVVTDVVYHHQRKRCFVCNSKLQRTFRGPYTSYDCLHEDVCKFIYKAYRWCLNKYCSAYKDVRGNCYREVSSSYVSRDDYAEVIDKILDICQDERDEITNEETWTRVYLDCESRASEEMCGLKRVTYLSK